MTLINYKKLIIKENQSITEALKIIQKNEQKILFVEYKKRQLIGTITDGDVRRALIKNNLVNNISDIMNRKPFYVKKKTKIINQNKTKFLFAPIVDQKKRIIDIIDLKKNYLKKNYNLVILAGGKGERLMPITKKIPKPIIKFGQISHLSSLLKKFINLGFNKIFVSINYLGNKIIKDLKWIKNEKVVLNFVKEKKFLGTAGPLSLINFKNNYPILLLNSDIITNINYEELLLSHKKSRAKFTICVKYFKNKVPFGVIKQKNNFLIDIEEKPDVNYLFNLGVYVIDQYLIKKIKRNSFLSMPDFIKDLLKEKIKINCHYIYEDWLDYGTKENLNLAKKNFKKKI